MNLKEFTEFVDQTAQELNQAQLHCLLHSIARKVPEENRGDFVVLLKDVKELHDVGEDGDSAKLKRKIKKLDDKEIRAELKRLRNLFSRIESAQLSIQADGDEDYSVGGGWEWDYGEADEISQAYEDGCRLVVRCVNDGFYEEAVELFDSMMETEVTVENDWEDFSMGLEELKNEKLISVNLENLALYVLYASYQTADPRYRAQKLYEYFSIHFFKTVSLERMFSLGREELGEQQEFWDDWISLLSKKSGDTAQRLLEEAVRYRSGDAGLLEAARLASGTHPSLYLKALQSFEQLHDHVKQLEVGKEALERVEKKYVIRSEIALKTAEAAIRLDKVEEAEGYWLEAFLSHTTPVNYLRLMVESRDGARWQKTVKDIILSVKPYVSSQYGLPKELTENVVSVYDRNILRFLDGDIEFVMELCRKVKKPLGWSSTFMKCGIPLLLLFLLEGDELRQGCTKMAGTVRSYMEFKAETYYKGTASALEFGERQTACPNELELFWKCFIRWKAGIVVEEKQAQRYLQYLERIIDQRVRAIVSGKFRAHYSSVAQLAAALGEVKESRGEQSAKAAILQKYREAYPRYSSFHAELRSYGMADTRKNRKK